MRRVESWFISLGNYFRDKQKLRVEELSHYGLFNQEITNRIPAGNSVLFVGAPIDSIPLLNSLYDAVFLSIIPLDPDLNVLWYEQDLRKYSVWQDYVVVYTSHCLDMKKYGNTATDGIKVLDFLSKHSTVLTSTLYTPVNMGKDWEYLKSKGRVHMYQKKRCEAKV